MTTDKRPDRGRYLAFAPSLLMGLIGALWVYLDPPRLGQAPALWQQALSGVCLAGILFGSAWVLERTVPAFKRATQGLERALKSLAPSPLACVLLAALSATGEELLFRGALQQHVGIWGQAVLFGLLHPVSKSDISYPLFTAFSALLLGYSVVLNHSLLPAMFAHFAINLHGLWQVRRP